MTYQSPVPDILFSLEHVAGLDAEIGAGRFATEAIAPLNRVGDLEGARYENGRVTSPPGFREVYRRWAEAGWAGLTASREYGGLGQPAARHFSSTEIWNGAST